MPLTTHQSHTLEAEDSLRHLRNVLSVIHAEYKSLAGATLAVGSTALYILVPLDNIKDIAQDLGCITHEAYAGLGVAAVKLVVAGEILFTVEVDI